MGHLLKVCFNELANDATGKHIYKRCYVVVFRFNFCVTISEKRQSMGFALSVLLFTLKPHFKNIFKRQPLRQWRNQDLFRPYSYYYLLIK